MILEYIREAWNWRREREREARGGGGFVLYCFVFPERDEKEGGGEEVT